MLFGGVVLLVACSRPDEGAIPRVERPTPVRVTVETLRPQMVADTIETVGTVRSRVQSVLSAKIVATVLGVQAREGDRVRAGQLLIVLDDRDVVAQLRRAEAGLREAQSGLDEVARAIEGAERGIEAARAQEELARTTLARYKRLVERELIAFQDYDEAAARARVAVADAARAVEVKAALLAKRDQMRARIEQAEAEAVTARIVTGYTRITAPAEGIVAAKAVDIGNLAVPGTPLLTIEEERYRLETTVQESDLPRLRLGQTAAVTVDAVGRELSAPIVEIVPAADPMSRTFLVKVELPPLVGIRSGLYGRARFTVGQRPALLVARETLNQRGQLEGVFVVDEGRVARLRLVKTGRAYGDRVEILSGLGQEDRVVREGARVTDGQTVEVP
jgi:multidrug efflux pump subunit AcrA (membrane-fusion protein)